MAIKYENGHYRSYRPVNEQAEILTRELARLTSRQRAAVEEIVRQYGVRGPNNPADIAEQYEWDKNTGPPIPIRQWVNDKYYLGETADTLFPRLKDDMVELFEGNYYECILCLHPDTRVPLLDGTTPTIKELADRWAVDPTPFWVYSYKDGTFRPAQAIAPRQTGVDDYFRVTLEDGTSFTGNARHQMVMRDGTKRMIRDMVIGDSIMPFDVRLSSKADGQTIDGYEQIKLPDGLWEYTHRLTARLLCEKQDGDEDTVHHVDFRKENNTPENLRWMRWDDHTDLHKQSFDDWRRANPEKAAALAERQRRHLRRLWEGTSGELRRELQSARLALRNSAGGAAVAGKLSWKNRSPEAKAAFSAMMVERNKTMGDRRLDVTIESIKLCGATNINEAAERLECSPTRIRRVLVDHGHTQTSFFGNRRGKRRGAVDVTLEAVQSAIDAGSKTPAAVAARLGCDKSTVYRALKKSGRKWSDLCALVGNHYVTKIEHIGSGPVYCMTVPDAGNFAISTSDASRCGVVSSNTGSIGWGKDYFATTALVRVLYELICLKSPTDTLGLGKGETIHIVPISHLKEAAQRVVFQGVSKKLHLSPFFRGRFEETKEEIRFPGKNVVIIGGGSNDNSALGLNVWAALVDELNFMGKGRRGSVSAGGQNARHDKGQGLYDTIQRRVKSRYAGQGLRGMVFLVSSKRSLTDFTERRIAEVMKDNDPGVFVRDYATWDVRTGAFKGQKWWTAVTSPREGKTRIIGEKIGEQQIYPPGEEPKTEDVVFSFPDQYYREFLNDPEGATRDIAGIAMESFKPFFSNRAAIDAMMKSSRPHPFHVYDWATSREIQVLWNTLMMDNVHGDPVPRCCPSSPRHAHADMSKNQDATGLCVGHRAGEIEVMRRDPETGEMRREEAPVIHIDLVLKIVPPYAGEIDHQAVRSLIYKLREGGLPIRSVSMDKWMGLPNLQLIAKHGFKVEEISTQRTLDPYLAARSALYEGRVSSPIYPALAKEIRELELNEQGTKIDHPKTGSKDLADAWAAVIYYLARNAQPMGAYGVTRGVSDLRQNEVGGVRPTGDGNFRWPDEPDPDIQRESDGLPSWIIC